MYLFISFLPILIHLLLMPVWIAANGNPETDIMFLTRITLFEMLFSFFTVFYIVAVNVFNLKNIHLRSFLPNYALMMLIVFLGPFVHYLNWGISTGRLLKPDPETVGIFQFQVVVSLIIVSIAGLIMKLYLANKNSSRKL